VSGRIIDADVDAIANIARLTGQIETMKRERDAARICFEIEREDGRKSDAQRDELQRLLTACEEECDAAQAEAAAMRQVIEEQLWRADHALEAFEEQAETFYRETGIMAPGKSEPIEWGNRWTDDERRTAWSEWTIKRKAEQVELWRALITGNAGRALAARVPLLEAVAKAARGLRWVHPLDRGRYEARFDEAMAALDEKGTP
jgi:hypothetical protein